MTKNIHFEKSHNVENCKRGTSLLQNIKKLKGDPLETLKSCRKKRKMIILNSLMVTKNVEGGLWAFSTSL